jgi:hypothetical protein
MIRPRLKIFRRFDEDVIAWRGDCCFWCIEFRPVRLWRDYLPPSAWRGIVGYTLDLGWISLYWQGKP